MSPAETSTKELYPLKDIAHQTNVSTIGRMACAEARSLHVGYFNYQDGGHVGTEVSDELTIYHYDYQGLVDVAGQDNEWPDVLVMGEGNFYDCYPTPRAQTVDHSVVDVVFWYFFLATI
jgi:hypothetical protein